MGTYLWWRHSRRHAQTRTAGSQRRASQGCFQLEHFLALHRMSAKFSCFGKLKLTLSVAVGFAGRFVLFVRFLVLDTSIDEQVLEVRLLFIQRARQWWKWFVVEIVLLDLCWRFCAGRG